MIPNLFKKFNYLLWAWSLFFLFNLGQLEAKTIAEKSSEEIFASDQIVSLTISNQVAQELEVYFDKVEQTFNANQYRPLSSVYGWQASKQPTSLLINYKIDVSQYLQPLILTWSESQQIWLPLKTTVSPDRQTVSALSQQQQAKIILVEQLPWQCQTNKISYYPLEIKLNKVASSSLSVINSQSFPAELELFSAIYSWQTASGTKFQLSWQLNQLDNKRLNLYYLDEKSQTWKRFSKQGLSSKADKIVVNALAGEQPLLIALVAEKNVLQGTATWYKYKNCDCAAARFWPKGTRLKITNVLAESKYCGRSVIVRVNDYGPEEWTGHIIDLDKTVFKKISTVGAGIIPVTIEVVSQPK